MKVRIDYSVEVSDDYRRAINLHYGLPGLATRDEVKHWFRHNGTNLDEDIMWDLQEREEAISEVIADYGADR